MKKVSVEMQRKADRFRVQYGEYFRNRISEKELMKETTQPFWQSMRLSRRRLEEKGLGLDVTLYRDKRKKGEPDGRVEPGKDGWSYTGISTDSVLTERRFQKDGKIIYRQKEHEISNVSLLRGDVEGDKAACPNCGYVGEISSFIDGCDYCDSKFLVSDFETKISGFSLEENQYKNVKKIFNKAFLTVLLMSLALVIVIIVAFIVTFGLLMMGQDGKGAVMSTAIMAYGLTSIPIYGRTLFCSVWFYIIGRVILRFLYREVITGEELVKEKLPGFSAADFYQNLEYKLRNIHFTNRAEEVQPFAGCDLTDIVAKYENVVDCALTGLRFLSAREEKSKKRYLVEAEARLKLTLIRNQKIRVRYERVKLELSGNYEMLEHNCNAIREYKCSGCGASVDILSGGICSHCGNRVDYGKYGWMIQRYESRKKLTNVRKRVQLAVFGMFLVIALANTIHFFGRTGENTVSWGQIFQMLTHTEEIMDGYYKQVPKPADAGVPADLVSEESSDLMLKRIWIYETEDAEAAFRQYVEYLTIEKKCTGDVEYTENPHAMLHMPIPRTEEIMQNYHFDESGIDVNIDMDDMDAAAIINVTVKEKQLIVEVELTDV